MTVSDSPATRQVLGKLTRARAKEVAEILEANLKTSVLELQSVPDVITDLHELRRRGIPIVVRGALRGHAFVQNWLDEAKMEAMAREEEVLAPHRKYTVYSPEEDGCLNQSDKMQECAVSFNRFLKLAKKEKRPMYLLGVPDVKGKHGASPLERLPTETVAPVFSQNLDDQLFFYEFYERATQVRRNVFFNSGYCFTNLHFDSDANAYLCASGRRRWSLCHPDQGKFLAFDKPNANRSCLRPTTGDFSKFPLAALIKFVSVDLSPGDVLLVPSGWWHVVEGGVAQQPGSFSCGVNWFFELPKANDPVPVYTEIVNHPSACMDVVSDTPLQRRLVSLVTSLGVSDDQMAAYSAAIAEVGERLEAPVPPPIKRRRLET